MKVLNIKFTSWDNPYYFLPQDKNGNEIKVKKGDEVIVDTSIGRDIGIVSKITEISDSKEEIKPIVCIADEDSLEKSRKNNVHNAKILKEVKAVIKRYNIEMKLSDVHVSLDDNMMIFAFIADGRIDFRELVKSLSRKYQKKIRLFQIGVRDEAKFFGDVGECGRVLCCRKFLKNLESINTGFARDQQVAHRGLEKLSGMCGRLKCCLAYEEKHYRELVKDMPNIGDKVKTESGDAYVVELLPLKQSLRVKLIEDKSYVEVELNKINPNT